MLPSYDSKATASLLCSLPILILFQFILIYLNFVEVFEWIWVNLSEKREYVKKLNYVSVPSFPTSVSHTY